jgi:hypothetical protein
MKMEHVARPTGWISAILLLSLSTPASSQHEHPRGGHQPPKAEEKQPEHSHERSNLHGGAVTMTELHHFETVFGPGEVRIYMYSETQTPMSLADAKATATMKTRDGREQAIPLRIDKTEIPGDAVYYCPMHPEVTKADPDKCPKCGMTLVPQDMLVGEVDLTGVSAGGAKLVVRIEGLKGKESSITFTESYR